MSEPEAPSLFAEERRHKIADDEVLASMSPVLLVAAHPDDAEFGAAGTVCRMTQAGVSVTYAVVTDGDAGGLDDAMGRRELARRRQEEQRAAAKEVGVTDVRFLGYQDGAVLPTLELRRDLARLIREVRPRRVICQSPEYNFDRPPVSHPDHRAVGQSALDAVYPDARNPYAFPELLEQEGLAPHSVEEVWVAGARDPDTFVDVTSTFDSKIAALSCHGTQIGDKAALEEMLRSGLGGAGLEAGMPEGHLAEAFRHITYR